MEYDCKTANPVSGLGVLAWNGYRSTGVIGTGLPEAGHGGKL
jgi:hypothetical protein